LCLALFWRGIGQSLNSMARHPSLAGILVLLLGLTAGCQRTPRWDRVVEADPPPAFGAWQRSQQDDFSKEEWAEFETALQDIKVRIIALREASGTEGVNDALRPKIHGQTVRQVLQQGLEARIWRLKVEEAELKKMIQGNATLRTAPGDTASSDYLERKHRDQQTRRQRAVDDIAQAEATLAGLAARK
jgi:hypothetical protein